MYFSPNKKPQSPQEEPMYKAQQYLPLIPSRDWKKYRSEVPKSLYLIYG